MNEPTEALLIDSEGVQKMLSISRTHFFRLNASGLIPKPVRLGRSTRWRVQELHAWIAAGMPPRVRWDWRGKA
jgi:predicted DNA-binding transcriptional regulator AlpA